MSKENFLCKLRERQPDSFNKYDYSKVDYINNHTKIIITCKEHGDFLQRPADHLVGNGCTPCSRIFVSNKFRKDKEHFLSRAKNTHGDKYDYSLVEYKNTRTPISILCKTHGVFNQRPDKHIQGRGCPSCNESYGERYLAIILDKLIIQYIREYKISGYNYRYDFYLPDYNIYIEYHGKQHYESDDFFGGKKQLIKQQRRDKIKIELVKRSSGLLIVLNYKLDTLEKLENELMSIFITIHPEFLIDKDLVRNNINKSKAYLINNGIVYGKRL